MDGFWILDGWTNYTPVKSTALESASSILLVVSGRTEKSAVFAHRCSANPSEASQEQFVHWAPPLEARRKAAEWERELELHPPGGAERRQTALTANICSAGELKNETKQEQLKSRSQRVISAVVCFSSPACLPALGALIARFASARQGALERKRRSQMCLLHEL